MADFLIITNPTNPSARRGDIVAVRADGAAWGSSEVIADGFAVYRQPGIAPADFMALQPSAETGTPWLDEALLPAGLIAAAEATGALDGTPEGLSVFFGAVKWR